MLSSFATKKEMAKTIKYNPAFTIKFKGYKRYEWIKDLLIVYWPKHVKQRLKKTI